MSHGRSFYDRWSRRKTISRENNESGIHKEVVKKNLEPVEQDLGTDEKGHELTDDQLIEKLNLPDPESFEQSTDFKAFLRKDVPNSIKQKAMRRLWFLNPTFAIVDGLDVYDGDYTDAATVIDGLATLYRAGSGYAKQIVSEIDDETELLRDDVLESERFTDDKVDGLSSSDTQESKKSIEDEVSLELDEISVESNKSVEKDDNFDSKSEDVVTQELVDEPKSYEQVRRVPRMSFNQS